MTGNKKAQDFGAELDVKLNQILADALASGDYPIDTESEFGEPSSTAVEEAERLRLEYARFTGASNPGTRRR